MNNYYQTIDGQQHNLQSLGLEKISDTISPEMVAHVQSHINRWNGNTIIPVNVAWHSVAVCRYASWLQKTYYPSWKEIDKRYLAFLALVHDAGEIFTGDLVSPLKQHLIFAQDPQKMMIIEELEKSIYDAIQVGLIEQLERNFTTWANYLPKDICHMQQIVMDADIGVRKIEKQLFTQPTSISSSQDRLWFTDKREIEESVTYKYYKLAQKYATKHRDKYWMPKGYAPGSSKRAWMKVWEMLGGKEEIDLVGIEGM